MSVRVLPRSRRPAILERGEWGVAAVSGDRVAPSPAVPLSEEGAARGEARFVARAIALEPETAGERELRVRACPAAVDDTGVREQGEDRKSTRLNSSHGYISYAVFCLK